MMNTTIVELPAGPRQWNAARKPFASLDAIGWDLVETAVASHEGAARLANALRDACGQHYPGRGCVIDWTATLSVLADGVEIATPTSGTLIRVTANSIQVVMSHLPEGYNGKASKPSTLGAGRLREMQDALFGAE